MDDIHAQNKIQCQHLKLMSKSLKRLEKQLERVREQTHSLDIAFDQLVIEEESLDQKFQRDTAQLEQAHQNSLNEKERCNHDLQTTLNDKLEERALWILKLRKLNLCDHLQQHIEEDNWLFLKDAAKRTNPQHQLDLQLGKAERSSRAVEDAERYIGALEEMRSTIVHGRASLQVLIDKNKHQIPRYKSIIAERKAKTENLKRDNLQLNLIIKHCALNDEPMTGYVAKTVRDRCHSFVQSQTKDELLEGLARFTKRQQSIIKLMRVQENKLICDTNQLQVATEETVDQVQFYK